MSATLNVTTDRDPLNSTATERGVPGALAQVTYDSLRAEGLSDVDIMAFAGELLSLVASGVREQPSQS